METLENSWPDLAALEEDRQFAAPPVVAVVVTHNPGPAFDEVLRSLDAQDYPDLTVLVLDAASEEDPRLRVAEILPKAFVRRESTASFGTTANEALKSVAGATYLLICHDDVILAPNAVRELVEEAVRSNAAIAGPKLVSAQNPRELLEVGMSIDRFGIPFSGLEPNELDQEQHDGVRDTFFVSSAAMLIRADLFAELSGFDPEAFPGSEDIDLCWRARLVGARIMVVPDAVVQHYEISQSRRVPDSPDAAAITRNRLRTILKCYSSASLAVVLPIGFALGCMESLVYLVKRQPQKSRALLSAWWWNFRNFKKLKPARREIQTTRRVHDSDFRFLITKGSARIRAFLRSHVRAEERLRVFSTASQRVLSTTTNAVSRPITWVAVSALVLAMFGAREFVFGDVPHVGTLTRWLSIGSLWESFSSAWRYTGMGSATAAPPAFLLVAALQVVTFGYPALAQALFLFLALPLAAWGTGRLARQFGAEPQIALVAGALYVVNPLGRNLVATGRFAEICIYVLAPFVLASVLRQARDDFSWPSVIVPGIGVGVIAAVQPIGALYLAAALIAVFFTARFTNDKFLSRGIARTLSGSAVVALVLLFPWPIAFVLAGDRAALGMNSIGSNDLASLLRFDTGPSGAGWIGYALVLAALLPLLISTGDRLVWAIRAWAIALFGFGVAYIPGMLAPRSPWPSIELGLIFAVIGLSLATAIGIASFVADLRTFVFGWRQIAAAITVGALAIPGLGFVVDAFDGQWRARSAWADSLAFLDSQRVQGEFRVLWIGNEKNLPAAPNGRVVGTNWTLTRNGVGNVTDLWPAPAQRADLALEQAVRLSAEGNLSDLGRTLAPLGVRYVAVVETLGPGSPRSAAPQGLRVGLERQSDLARLFTEPGVILYENTDWIPVRAVVPDPDSRKVPVAAPDPLQASAQTDLENAQPLSNGAPAGTLLLAESYNKDWRASAKGDSLRQLNAFGLTNGFVASPGGNASMRFSGQWVRNLAVLIQLGLWVLIGAAAWKRRKIRKAQG